MIIKNDPTVKKAMFEVGEKMFMPARQAGDELLRIYGHGLEKLIEESKLIE